MDPKQATLQVFARMLEVAQRLRDAMMTRDAEAIQNVVSEQDELQELVYEVPHGAGAALQDDPDVKRVAEKLRRLQQGNRMLASAFLGVYRNTFKSSDTAKQEDPGMYGRNGAVFGTAPASILVQQTG